MYENGQLIGYTGLSQATVGFQAGGQGYSELLIFESKEALDKFKTGNFAFSAAATTVAVKSGRPARPNSRTASLLSSASMAA